MEQFNYYQPGNVTWHQRMLTRLQTTPFRKNCVWILLHSDCLSCVHGVPQSVKRGQTNHMVWEGLSEATPSMPAFMQFVNPRPQISESWTSSTATQRFVKASGLFSVAYTWIALWLYRFPEDYLGWNASNKISFDNTVWLENKDFYVLSFYWMSHEKLWLDFIRMPSLCFTVG